MTEAALFKLADVVLTLVSMGIEAEAIRARVQDLESQGKSAQEVTESLHAWRLEEEAKTQTAIDAMPEDPLTPPTT